MLFVLIMSNKQSHSSGFHRFVSLLNTRCTKTIAIVMHYNNSLLIY